MFCNLFFRPINHLPAGEGVANETVKGVANARRKQSNSAQPFSWAWGLQQKQPQITSQKRSEFVFLISRWSEVTQKIVAPHLMCSRIFFR